jgi:surfeit locus 1 family protein
LTSRRGLRWAAAAFAVTACIGFLALAVWQVERRAWKLDLIDRVDKRVHAEPVDAPSPDRWATVDAAHDEYRHVRLRGSLLNDSETLVQASTELGTGFWLMTPLRAADGSVVLVNRGFVPPEHRTRAPHDAGEAEQNIVVTGLLRVTEPGGGFLRHNDAPNDRWYSRDVSAIAKARGLHAVAPYFIDADRDPSQAIPNTIEPVGGLTVISFHNNHAVYALTWFALALMSAWGAWRITAERSSADAEEDLVARD